ncbi:MAG: hypothetical protein SGILL_005626 [Bacillariaceae sp.]
MMNRLLTLLALALIAATASVNAFVVGGPQRTASVSSLSKNGGAAGRTFQTSTTTQITSTPTTALSLKVDPNSIKKNNSNLSGKAKGAAYGGSIAIAVLLPVAFLVWSAVSH